MNIQEFENLIVAELVSLMQDIIINNIAINISAKSRAGAEISDWLEDIFVEYTQNHRFFKNTESAPKGKTKNPWDAKTYLTIDSISEKLWIDFKAIKIDQIDSNPDIGTPTKIIDFINQGNFYIAYIYVYYQSQEQGLRFVQIDNSYTKIYLLKDISSTVRRNPKNQLQVNISQSPEYRSREDFINLIVLKLAESYKRQILISQKNLDKLESRVLIL
jgi:hypothetical protein